VSKKRSILSDVGWVERKRYPTNKPESWVSFLNPTYLLRAWWEDAQSRAKDA